MFPGKKNSTSFAFAVMVGILLLGSGEAMAQQTNQRDAAMEAVRISPQETHQQVTSGKALLVCAYQNEQICRDIMLEGAIAMREFEQKLPGLKKNQAIIFYCQ